MLGAAVAIGAISPVQEIIVTPSVGTISVRTHTLVVALVVACALLAGCDLGTLTGGALTPAASAGDGATTRERGAGSAVDGAGTSDAAGDGSDDPGGSPVDALPLGDARTGDEGHTVTDLPPDVVPGSRKALLAELEGFGRRTTGGLAGPAYVVKNLNDSGPGSLRAGAQAEGARWIEFADGLSGTITLGDDVRVRGSKTIDGRGADITLDRGGLQVTGDNVIIAHLRFVNTREDAVSFYGGRRNGWVHHNTFIGRRDWQQDGAVDIADRSTDITVSWNRFENWDKTSLATWEHFTGESVSPSATKVRFTYHHNHFKGARQRQPLVRTALLHSYNNWFEHYGRQGTGMAVQACNYAEVLSERNIYDDIHDRPAIKTMLSDCSAPGKARSLGDLFTGSPGREIREPDRVFDAGRFYDYDADPVGAALRNALSRSAGA